MKINETIGLLNRPHNPQAKKNEKNQSFTSVMEAVQAKIEFVPPNPAESFWIDPLACMGNGTKVIESKKIVDHAATLLDLMESFANALGDPKKSLKSIEPIVRQIDMQSKDLEISSEGMNHELSKVLREISMTAKIATMKFDRGDYI